MMSLVTQPFDLSPTHDSAAFAIFPPGSALRAVARERAHDGWSPFGFHVLELEAAA